MSSLEEQANLAMRDARWDTSIQLWEKVRQRRPEYLRAYISGIECLIRAYRMEDVEEVVAEVERRFPESVSANTFLATYAGRRGHWKESVGRFERIAARSSTQCRKVMANPHYRQAVMNSEGIIAGSHRLSTVTHTQAQVRFETSEQAEHSGSYVFVSGMPRSGTTALGHLLNAHPSIALFTELQNPYLAYSPASFNQEMLKTRSSENPAAVPDSIVSRVGSARYIGDKRPLFHYGLPHSAQSMRSERVVVLHILRPFVHVAASYHGRAVNPEDQWDPLRDLNVCIDEFNRMNEFLLEWKPEVHAGTDHKLFLVDYSLVFSSEQYALDLFNKLALPESKGTLSNVQKLLDRSKKIMKRPRPIDSEVLSSIADRLDFEAAHSVQSYTGIDILSGI